MNTFLIIIGALCVMGIVANLLVQLRRPHAATDERDWAGTIAKLEKEVEMERKEKNELAGKGKELYGRFKDLEAEYKAALKERDALQRTLAKEESVREAREKEHRDMVQKLENAERALEKERQRVIRDDDERRAKQEEERDRLWNDHEQHVVATIVDLCKQPHLQFSVYTNATLPDDFDGSLKPDVLVEFLGQYVVFDAKVSKAQNLQTYIDDQVKKTAEKMRKSDKIYPHIFLVVPTEAIGVLRKLSYAKEHFTFYVISREALGPILAALKRISVYELAETLDPQKRENIINMLADLALHISYRNAHELLLTKLGAETLERVARTDPEIASEIEQRRSEKKLSQLTPSEIKRLTTSLTEQNIEMSSLASPKAAVDRSMLQAAQTAFTEKLL